MTFETMFQTIHGYAPFPWQSEAASLLMTDERDISVSVPTASGKSALIDAALYAAAHGGPRRIIFIIDRRVVVDEAHQRARRIEAGLSEQAMSALKDKLGDIQVVRLRGAVHGDDEWVLYPERVSIILSTVDQVGSRLLHRGYGVSPRMAPMHAGFLGNDCTYIVDEAHLSVPFVQTVQATRSYGADIRLITMTATPISKNGKKVALSERDLSHPILTRRLNASKSARLVTTSSSENDFVKAAVDVTKESFDSGKVIGVVVNRVAIARRIYNVLKKQGTRAELLTGRVRAYDRDLLMKNLFPKICAGRDRKKTEPLVIVATQTIEVGADIDFDVLITEAAPLDALRQRFGRLDRLGELGYSKGTIIYREPQQAKPDPVYGMAIHDTWKWRRAVAKYGLVDFGIAAIDKHIRMLPPPRTEPKEAPVLLPSHIKMLSQTGPDAPKIDVSSWLHGAGRPASDISIIWRADLVPEDPTSWGEVVSLRPPLTREALEIPIYAARAWLQGKRAQDVTDIEGASIEEASGYGSAKSVLRWRGQEDFEVIQPDEIVVGDTIVLPAAYGGCDKYGWAPTEKSPVKDIADFCSLERGRSHVVRLVPGLTSWLRKMEPAVKYAVDEVVAAETEVDPEIGLDPERLESAHADLRELLKEIDHPLIKSFRGRYVIEMHPVGLVLRGKILDEIAGTLHGGVAIALDLHLSGCGQKAEHLAGSLNEREKITRAAQIHDLGKKETRFQIMLHGDPFKAAAGPALAKSKLRKLVEKRAAYIQSGLPRGFRHELASLEMSEEKDPLIRHLVGTHHGFGRPWHPVCQDEEALGSNQASIASGWLQSFANLMERHNPWFLAGMELVVRAADARQSIEEQETANA